MIRLRTAAGISSWLLILCCSCGSESDPADVLSLDQIATNFSSACDAETSAFVNRYVEEYTTNISLGRSVNSSAIEEIYFGLAQELVAGSGAISDQSSIVFHLPRAEIGGKSERLCIDELIQILTHDFEFSASDISRVLATSDSDGELAAQSNTGWTMYWRYGAKSGLDLSIEAEDASGP